MFKTKEQMDVKKQHGEIDYLKNDNLAGDQGNTRGDMKQNDNL